MNTELARGAAAIEKGAALFLRLVDDAGATPLSALAQAAGLPISTAQRIVAAYVRSGLLSRIDRGRYGAGLRLAAITAAVDTGAVLAAASRPLLRQLAREVGTTVHLGVLEGDMVTYLVKEHGGGPALLTREMVQLEAYCSGIGKVLLAYQDEAAREAYLAAGPFVPLTRNTMTDPAALRAAFLEVRAQGFATDDAEVEDDLYCLAVPLCGPDGRVVAALSSASRSSEPVNLARLKALRSCAGRIERRLGSPQSTSNRL